MVEIGGVVFLNEISMVRVREGGGVHAGLFLFHNLNLYSQTTI
jgi:hypothetical protein